MPNPHPNVSGLTPGGTSLSGGHTHSPRISVTIPAQWKTQLDTAARQAEMGTSKLVREIIREWLASRS